MYSSLLRTRSTKASNPFSAITIEKLTYSIVIAEKGFEAFVDLVLNSEEYMQRFGYDTVPLEISRVLPGRAVGEAPVYQELPRYSYDWQEKLISNDMMMSIEDHLNFG